MDLFSLKGKKALLIGYEGNLGPIFMDALSEAGCTVLGVGLPEFDIKYDEDRKALYRRTLRSIGVPDIVVCNAAIDTPPSVKDARFFHRFEETLDTNLTGHAKIVEILADVMRGGVFVFIGSIQGYVGADWRNYTGGFEKPCAYNLSKAALQQLARSITVQYGRRGIRAVCPGFGPYLEKFDREFVEKITRNIPMGKGVSTEDLKRTLLYACCCEGLAGEDWLVDGGYTKI
ncbi:MAG: SDR family NAD(P)-dependent oxidoreductase [Planctomycetota bacterium]|jgi:NAD(P)-dependent dehydrogenase (short-subunit alcohol dehydrogenase family)